MQNSIVDSFLIGRYARHTAIDPLTWPDEILKVLSPRSETARV